MIFAFKINTALKKHIFVKKSQVHWGGKANNLDFQSKPENNPDSKPNQARSLNAELCEGGLTEVKQIGSKKKSCNRRFILLHCLQEDAV